MADDNHTIMNTLVKSDHSLKKGRADFATAMQKMGFTSVFDIVRLPKRPLLASSASTVMPTPVWPTTTPWATPR
ncbi:hypothetical protein [Pseudomonas iridis]|uniref:hypothetical protein n=1 Tax=Pseudomonas iridis TaxID=2710587 RepID=UPI001E4066B3|nr:hypothetical protein [Pseudomonas iridis]